MVNSGKGDKALPYSVLQLNVLLSSADTMWANSNNSTFTD